MSRILSTGGGGGAWGLACMVGGMHGRGAWVVGGMCGRYYEIWSMSGRYASYWNAFLLVMWAFESRS